jgi:hypothetical protein
VAPINIKIENIMDIKIKIKVILLARLNGLKSDLKFNKMDRIISR